MLLDKLRISTKETHEALEQAMFPHIKNLREIVDYTKLLHLFYGYYKPLQDAVDTHIDLSVFPEYAQLRKAEWILEDLAALGEPAIDIPIYHFDFTISSHADALGALYVTEGSTLGGKVICKTIATNLGKTDFEGLKFFNGYGNDTGRRWKSFLSVLNNYSDTKEENAIIRSANNVFVGFKKRIMSDF